MTKNNYLKLEKLIADLTTELKTLTEDERQTVFDILFQSYCQYCGKDISDKSHCNCNKDE